MKNNKKQLSIKFPLLLVTIPPPPHLSTSPPLFATMPSLYTSIEINAPKSMVWSVLLHKEDWLSWNTFLYDRDSCRPFRQGQPVQLSLRRSREEAETEFEAQVLVVQPENCLRWTYSAPGFRSEHSFDLQDIGWNRTRYTHQETITGVMSRLFLPFLRQDEHQGLKRMARELKQFSEFQESRGWRERRAGRREPQRHKGHGDGGEEKY